MAPPQFAMKGALTPANTIGHEILRQNLRIIVIAPSCKPFARPMYRR
jgi:hypothetical protein